MQGSEVHTVEIVFLLLLLFVVVFGTLARKLNTPYPIVMVIGGLLLSFIPGIPKVTLNPDLIFLVVLPPLLFSAGWLTSWREFSYNLVSILLLAVGLVAFTVLGVAQAAHWFLPGFDWRMGFVLGAVVAPTDAIAATSIAKRIGLPKRIVDILEGESLVNDATALLALEFGIAMLNGGNTPTLLSGSSRLLYLSGAGILVGLLVGEIVHRIEHLIDDGPIEIALSILTPYAAYLAAESLHSSGVLAAVTCGLYLSRKSSHFFSPSVRLQAQAVWDSLTFALNGLVFVLIGLQLPYVLEAVRGHSLARVLTYGALFSALLILLRLVWTYPGAYLANLIRSEIFRQKEKVPSLNQIFVVGWTGMRGVISLAAAIALPQTLENGDLFVQRNFIIFLAFSVILVTLVFQGLTLPPLIRALHLAGAPETNTEENEARRTMLQTVLRRLEQSAEKDEPQFATVYQDLAQHYQQRLASLNHDLELTEADVGPNLYKRYVDLSQEMLRVERGAAVQLRTEGRIDDELLRRIERELDLEETRLLL